MIRKVLIKTLQRLQRLLGFFFRLGIVHLIVRFLPFILVLPLHERATLLPFLAHLIAKDWKNLPDISRSSN